MDVQRSVVLVVILLVEFGLGYYMGKEIQKKKDKEEMELLQKDNEDLCDEVMKLRHDVTPKKESQEEKVECIKPEVTTADDVVEIFVKPDINGYYRAYGSSFRDDEEEDEDSLGEDGTLEYISAGTGCEFISEDEFGEHPFDQIELHLFSNGVLTYEDGMLEHDGDLPAEYLDRLSGWKEEMLSGKRDYFVRNHGMDTDIHVCYYGCPYTEEL